MPASPAPAPLRALLRAFRAQRPLRAGSLLVTICGDAIAPRGGAVTLGSLIRLAAPFGLSERLVRTSVARLAREGWLAARREGRRSEYHLSAQGAQRFAEATRRIYGRHPGWDGYWTLLVLANGRRHKALRATLRWLGFGQLTPGMYAHPGAAAQRAAPLLRSLPGLTGALLLRARAQGRSSERQLVRRGWDLKQLARGYRRFLRTFATLEPHVRGTRLSPEEAFLVRTLLIHEYRKIHLQDPQLPRALLPQEWVGAQAYELTRRIYTAVFARAEAHLSEHARRLHARLPPATRAARARFRAPRRRR
jgi:phenylacetic acid degradation operon negative regulatory protein